MESRKYFKLPPEEHIASIYKSFSASSRILESFTNLSNTVIDTALSGQNKFIYEVLQNADDSSVDELIDITVRFILQDGYFIIQHDGKAFDFYDVERICDYASQIKEVKENDLGKTGYKGLGFKSLFNLSKCIYIYSGGYSFRFDKSYYNNPDCVPWQVIPVWTKDLPLSEKYGYHESVNFILKVKKAKQLQKYLEEILNHPEAFLFLRHVNKFCINVCGEEHVLDRKLEKYENFTKCTFYKNQSVVSTWLLKTFESAVPGKVKKIMEKGSKYTYPEKIKTAMNIPIIFALQIDDTSKEIIKTSGLCFTTLPTQLHTKLPYHVNSFFILNLDRTQLDENDFNEFLFHEIGYLQLNLLKDIAKLPHWKIFIIELLTENINHPYSKFNKAFSLGFLQGIDSIAWLPSKDGSRLLKLNEAWIDEVLFFKENFKDVTNEISKNIIDYDIKNQNLLPAVTKRFTYEQLFDDFCTKYYPYFDDSSYVNFISYLHKSLKNYKLNSSVISKLKEVTFLRTKNGDLVSPKHALLDEIKNPIPAFYELNPIDNKFLPLTTGNSLHDWLAMLGAKRLKMPVHVLRESLLKWIDSNNLNSKITTENHISIINYLAENAELLTKEEIKKLKENLIVLTKSKEFKLMKTCYLPEAFPVKELEDVISCHERILPVYNMVTLRKLLARLGIQNKLTPLNLFRKSILTWVKNNEVNFKLTPTNYDVIVEYFASNYSKIEEKLTRNEVLEMRKMPVLTCAQTFEKADVCYFDTALPNIPGFECLVSKGNLICSRNISKKNYEFLIKIGVSKEIHAIEIIRKSVLKWIREGSIKSKINFDNHQNILKYIAEKWEFLCLSGFEQYEKLYFRKFPILTKDNTFTEACHCYWPTSGEKIPHIEAIIPPNNFASLDYSEPKIKELLSNEYFGVRSLTFIDVYEKYCDHLTDLENIRWFFFHLISYWINSSLDVAKILLTRVKEKLSTSYLLTKNGQLCLPAELYSYRFSNIYDIDPSSVPILDIEFLPEDLEIFLGFKSELEMPCIMKLLEAFGIEQKNGTMNEVKTKAFFTTLLEQLRCKNVKEIRKFKFKLLSQANELKYAEDLYYFDSEDSTCRLNECYLKRICDMSHEDTLELAKLCRVNVLPFSINATFENKKYLNTLQKYYLERLPFIVLKESNKVNDNPLMILKKLYRSICSIKLFECQDICIQYPFGEPVEERFYFDDLKIYVTDNWQDYNSYIHKHLKDKLHLKADINDITDMQNISQKKKDDWIKYENLDLQMFRQVEKEIGNLSSRQEENTVDGKIFDSKDNEDFADSLPINLDYKPTDEQTNKGNTLPRYIKQESIVSDQQSSDSNDIEDVVELTSDTDSENDEITYGNRKKNENISYKHSSYFEESENVSDSIFKFDENSPQVSATYGDALRNFSGQQNTATLNQQQSAFEETERAEDYVFPKYFDSTSDNILSPNVGQENKKINDGQSYDPETKVTRIEIPDINVNSTQEDNITSSLRQVNTNFNEFTFDFKVYDDIPDSLRQKSDRKSEQEKYNCTLKQFYFDRLPFIVMQESTKLNQPPYVILKNLYRRISSIELIPYSRSYKKGPCSVSSSANHYFDGLKIYVLGNWMDYKNEIHEHIVQELCLNSNVADIISMETIKENHKEEWIRFHKANSETFHEIEVLLQNLKQNYEISVSSEDGNVQLKDNILKDEFYHNITEKHSKENIVHEHHLTTHESFNSGIGSATKTESYKFERPCNDNEKDILNENYNRSDSNYSKTKVKQTQAAKKVVKEDAHSSSTGSLSAESTFSSERLIKDKSKIQRLNESYVFTFLQDYYKAKHPKARCTTLGNDYFTLEWESHRMVITWMNESGDKELLFDISVITDFTDTKFIEVQSIENANGDSISINDCIFKSRDSIFVERMSYRKSFRIFCVINGENSTTFTQQKSKPLAVYKVVPLML